MKLFKTGTTGTPLILLNKTDYPHWLSQQTCAYQRWLESNDYAGEGLCLIPGHDGQIDQAIFAAENLDTPYACAALPELLPQADYLPQITRDSQLQNLALAWAMGAYQFDRYTEKTATYASLVLPSQAYVDKALRFADAITLVRNLINTPAGDMMPEHLFEQLLTVAEPLGAIVTSLVGDELLQHNYPTIHAVGRASIHAPRLIDLRWGNPDHPKVTLVGKGVCFDSGGLNLKGALGMRNMKKDMGGAANAIGLACLVMSHQLPVNLRLLIPAVENAVSNNAYRPGDVIITRKGLTVEVENTDAEGRLVLCDALAEADRENPELLLDFATLTGACRVALGLELPGFFCNSPSLAHDLLRAGEAVSDPVWQLPLYQPYRELLSSDVADLASANQKGDRNKGGAIAAALYLQSFVSDNTAWAHFDINGTNGYPGPGRPPGGEAVAIRAVFHYLSERYA